MEYLLSQSILLASQSTQLSSQLVLALHSFFPAKKLDLLLDEVLLEHFDFLVKIIEQANLETNFFIKYI